MVQGAGAVGHNWEWINQGLNHFTFARAWVCRGCGRRFKGENPPEGVCSLSLAPKAQTFAGADVEKVVFEVLTSRYGVASLEAKEAAEDIRKALEAAPKGGTQ